MHATNEHAAWTFTIAWKNVLPSCQSCPQIVAKVSLIGCLLLSGLGTGMLSGGTIFPGQNLQVHNAFYTGGTTCLQSPATKLTVTGDTTAAYAQQSQTQQPAFYFASLPTSVAVSLSTATNNATPTVTSVNSVTTNQPIKFQSVASHAEVSQVRFRNLPKVWEV